MRPSYDAGVAQPLEQVWASLADIDSVLAALPGAALARDGDAVSGSLRCKLGATQVTYRLSARAEMGETEFHTAVIAVTGKEARGAGTLVATLTVSLRAEGAETRVEVSGDVEATGRAESAGDQAWSRVLETLVNAVIPPPAPDPVAPQRPSLAVAPPLFEPVPSGDARSARQRQLRFGLAAVALLLLVRRWLRRRRSEQAL
jgi:carbon monoxide dehydrogenase subunit G